MEIQTIRSILIEVLSGYDIPPDDINDAFIINGDILTGEDGENFIVSLCERLEINPRVFEKQIPFDSVFERSQNIAFLPLVPFYWIKSKFTSPLEKPTRLSVIEFSALIQTRFFQDKTQGE